MAAGPPALPVRGPGLPQETPTENGPAAIRGSLRQAQRVFKAGTPGKAQSEAELYLVSDFPSLALQAEKSAMPARQDELLAPQDELKMMMV